MSIEETVMQYLTTICKKNVPQIVCLVNAA